MKPILKDMERLNYMLGQIIKEIRESEEETQKIIAINRSEVYDEMNIVLEEYQNKIKKIKDSVNEFQIWHNSQNRDNFKSHEINDKILDIEILLRLK